MKPNKKLVSDGVRKRKSMYFLLDSLTFHSLGGKLRTLYIDRLGRGSSKDRWIRVSLNEWYASDSRSTHPSASNLNK